MGMIVGLAFVVGLAVSGVTFAISIGFVVLSSALTRQARHGPNFVKYGIAITVVTAVAALWLFNIGGGPPSGSDYEQWMVAGFVLGLSPGIGFAASSLVVWIRQIVTRVREDKRSPPENRGARLLTLLAVSLPILVAMLVAAWGYGQYRSSQAPTPIPSSDESLIDEVDY